MTQNLITRLSKLDAPDREVDAEIALQNGWSVFPGDRWIGPEGKIVVPEYTRSVDAAIALAERVLPGCDIEISDVHADFRGAKEPRHMADLSSDLVWEKYDGYPEPVYRIRGTGQSNIRAIALLIALLRAKEASQ